MEWRIKQDGIVVSGGNNIKDMPHYASQYVEEGSISVETKEKGGRWKRAFSVEGQDYE